MIFCFTAIVHILQGLRSEVAGDKGECVVQIFFQSEPESVCEIQQVAVGLHAGGGDQGIHMYGKLLIAHVDFLLGTLGLHSGEQIYAVNLAGLNLCHDLLCAISFPQALRRPEHLAGVEAAVVQPQRGHLCGQLRAEGFPCLTQALV